MKKKWSRVHGLKTEKSKWIVVTHDIKKREDALHTKNRNLQQQINAFLKLNGCTMGLSLYHAISVNQ